MVSEDKLFQKRDTQDINEDALTVLSQFVRRRKSSDAEGLTPFEYFINDRYQTERKKTLQPVERSSSLHRRIKNSHSLRRIITDDVDLSKTNLDQSIIPYNLNSAHWKYKSLRSQDHSVSMGFSKISTNNSSHNLPADHSHGKNSILNMSEVQNLPSLRKSSELLLRKNLFRSREDEDTETVNIAELIDSEAHKRTERISIAENLSSKRQDMKRAKAASLDRKMLKLPMLDLGLHHGNTIAKQKSSQGPIDSSSSALKRNRSIGYLTPGAKLVTTRLENLQTIRELALQQKNSLRHQSEEDATFTEHIPLYLQQKSQFLKQLKDSRKYENHKISAILSKPYQERSIIENRLVTNYFSKIDLFSSFDLSNLQELCEYIQVLSLKKGDVLCKQNDAATCIWIIIEGEVAIYRGDEKAGLSKSGEVLGRQALDKKTLRTATLVVDSDEASIAMLPSSDFHRLVATPESIMSNQAGIIAFLIKIPFFRQLKNHRLQSLSSHLGCKIFYKNEIIYRKDDASNELFILYKGSLQKEAVIQIEKTNRWPVSVRQWNEVKVQQSVSITLPIEVGDIFGFREMFLQIPREEKIVVYEESIVFFIQREKIMQRIAIIFIATYFDLSNAVFSVEEIEMFLRKEQEHESEKHERFRQVYINQQRNLKKKKQIVKDAFFMNLEAAVSKNTRRNDLKLKEWQKSKEESQRTSSPRKKTLLSIASIKSIAEDI